MLTGRPAFCINLNGEEILVTELRCMVPEYKRSRLRVSAAIECVVVYEIEHQMVYCVVFKYIMG